MSETTREFDVIVWGATGFTGQLVVEYLYDTYGVAGTAKWAIAGRSESKLEAVRKQIAGEAADGIPMIVADSNDQESLNAMVARTRVMCTTVGPYAKYGTGLVEACANHGTHYCDLTGEVPWMRKMIDQYQTIAEASGARIVHTCGFDSIPSDMGVYFMQKAMHEKHGVYASHIKYRVGDTSGGFSGGTVESLINMIEESREDPGIRDILADPYALNPRNMPQGPDQGDQVGAVYDPDFRAWTAPFVMSGINTRVVRRANALMNYQYGKDFRYDEAMLMPDGPLGYMAAATVSGGMAMVMGAAAFAPTRSLLRSLAPSPGEGPDKDARDHGYFKIRLLAKHPTDRSLDLAGQATGDKDPGYGSTSKMLAESALCLALDEIDVAGGFWTPASAMGDKLLTRLVANAGLTFELKA